ncbi:LamG-like jellyroll fold domain-containing protein (plasmid) [Azospirillum sp. A26]|uniref:LamG-like jellyroll fold domain-containing protein n=1 Tax=Azospirillum sp. A26 TaxID=3160607 RepID=UPI003670CB2A
MAGWYRQGTVALTPGSAAVAGAGTMWMGVVRPGSAFTTDGRTLYEIREVANDRMLTLDRPWEGETAAASAYAVIAASATLSNAELAAEIAAMVAKWAVREDQYDDWLGGSPNGGPNADGKYPLTDSKGVTRLVESPARLLQLLDDGVVEHAAQIIAAIEDDVATARQAAADATAAMTAVATDRQAVAQAAATVAVQAGESTAAAATATAQAAIAVHHADEAAGSAATTAGLEASATAALAAVEAARDIVLEARTEAGTAATGALSARTAAEVARDTATAARDAAQQARDAAVTARTQAQDWAVKTDAPVSGNLKSALSYALDAASQATVAIGKATEAAGSAAAAAASAAGLDTAATAAQAAAGNAATGAQTATAKASAAAISADIARSAAQQAEAAGTGSATARTAAEAARDSAVSSMTAAQVAASQAGQSQTNAVNSAQTAATAAADAISAKSDATAARDLAVAARTEAQGARDLSQAFAQGAVGYQPSPGVYSAFHWSEQAKGHAQTAATIVGGSNFGIVGDGASQRFAADNPGSLLNLVQAPGGKLTFSPGNHAVSFGFDAATAPVAAIPGMTATTVQGALEEIETRIDTLSPDTIQQAGGSVLVATDGSVAITPAAGRTATYNGSVLHTSASAYSKAETDTALGLKADKTTTYTKTQTDSAITVASVASAAKLTTAHTIALSGGATGTATSFDGSANITIPVTAIDATKIVGTVPLASMPAAALERLVPVATQTARYALATTTVQIGDTVKETDTGKMFYLKDEANIGNSAGWEEYSVGTAALANSAPWSGLTGRPALIDAISALDNGNGLLLQTSATTVSKRAVGVSAGTDIPDRDAADTRYVLRTGGTASALTGNLFVSTGAAEGGIRIRTNPGAVKNIRLQATVGASTLNRWDIGANGVAESGANAGTDFFINRFDDAGAYIDTPFSISRATSIINFTVPPTVNGNAVQTIATSYTIDQTNSAISAAVAGLSTSGISQGDSSVTVTDNGAGGKVSVKADNSIVAEATATAFDFKVAPTVNGAPLQTSANGAVTKSAVTVLPAAGTINVVATTIPAVYTQFVGQAFNVDYNTEANYIQENAATGTDQVGGQFQLYSTGGGGADAATKLLIHADGVNGSTEIIDERSITPFGTHCGWFDGASYWAVPQSSKNAFGASQNFTYECWIRPTVLAGVFLDARTQDGSGYDYGPQISLRGDGTISIYCFDTTTVGSTASLVTANAWNHIAVVRYNGTRTMYVNGVSVSAIADTRNYTAQSIRIGCHVANREYFSGWMDQIRVSKIARYSANFTVPTTAFVTDNDTVYLFSFDDGHGGQVLKDRANSGREVQLTGSLSTAQAKFGTTSALLSGGFVIFDKMKGHADLLSMGVDNFTWEVWAYMTSASGVQCLFVGNSGTYAPKIQYDSGVMKVYLASGTSSFDLANGVSFGSFSANSWHHVAMTRNGSSVYCFIDGVLGATISVGSNSIWPVNNAAGWAFGADYTGSNPWGGYIDEFRAKRGEAVWTSSFTPPTTAYATADNRTIILCHFEGANGDKVTLDSSGSSYGTNAFGDTTTPSLTFANNNGMSLRADYTRGGHATSLGLNGFNQYASMQFATPSAGHPIYFGASTKLCIEGWVYLTSVAGQGIVFSLGNNANGGGVGSLMCRTGSSTQLYVNDVLVASAGAASVGWNHVAAVRDARGWAVCLNGVISSSSNPEVNIGTISGVYALYLGTGWSGSAWGYQYLSGAIDAIRITNGQPRYTANFTPATLVADDMTTLMWEFNGAVDQKWVKELSGNGALVAANGNPRTVKDGGWIGSVQTGANISISTANSKFGGASMTTNQTIGNNYYSLWASNDWLLPGDFTIDFWTNAPNAGDNTLIDGPFRVRSGGSGQILFELTNGATIAGATFWMTSQNRTLNVWNHVAVVRSGSTLTTYFNGAVAGQWTGISGNLGSSSAIMRLFNKTDGTLPWSGYTDELRISVGTARWTAGFTPPTLPYGASYVTGPFYVATTNASRIDVSDWSTIHAATIMQTTPPGTGIKWLVSFDGRATWRKWDGSAWVVVPLNSGASIDTNGNDYLTLQTALTNLNVESYSTIDFAFSLKTANPNFSPSVDAVTLARDEYELGAARIDYTIKRNGAAGAEIHRITNLKPYPVKVVYDYVA